LKSIQELKKKQVATYFFGENEHYKFNN
jgi:hypothetical protein